MVEHLPAGPAPLLGPVHRGVGVTDQRAGVGALAVAQGDAGAHADEDLGVADGQRRLGDLLGEAAAGAGIDAGELASVAMPVVRRMIQQAFLLPVPAQ